MLAATLGQLDEMTNLVAEIFELARGDQQRLEDDDVRLDEIVEDAVERVQASTSSVEFQTAVEPTVARGVASRLARAIGNLLDNAAKWSPPGGTVEVTLSGGELVVRDHGPGVELEDAPHVFDRFYRSRAARGKPGADSGWRSSGRWPTTTVGPQPSRTHPTGAQCSGCAFRCSLPAPNPPRL